jgi:hypothetical protein
MKYLAPFFILFLMSLTACGPSGVFVGKGEKGDTGAQGEQGIQGEQGSTGAQGPRGADGTTITIVQLCPGAPSYGTFVELAQCINGKLYGVYSANGGFLAYFADGNYTSNGIGSACNLTVSGCTVTH